jgi:hypothetical protein
MRTGTVAGLGVCLLALAGCGSHANGGDASAPSDTSAGDASGGGSDLVVGGDDALLLDADPMTAAGFCGGYLEIVAEAFASCFAVPLAAARESFSFTAPCDRFAADLAAGRLAFNGAHGAECLRELRAASLCTGAPSMAMPDTTACAALVTPLVAPGGACTSFYIVNLGEQCQGAGMYCLESGTYACGGVCTPRLALGAPCEPLSETRCALGATCSQASKTCVVTPPLGAAGAPCTDTTACTRDLYCDTTTTDGGATGGVCRARKTSGPCVFSEECAIPRDCLGPTDAKTCAVPKQDGEACVVGKGECNLIGHCGADGICTSVRAAVGQPCGLMNGERYECVTGAYCSRAGTCQPYKQAGDACTAVGVSECGGNNGHCDGATLKCASCPI